LEELEVMKYLPSFPYWGDRLYRTTCNGESVRSKVLKY